ncbi:MAG: cob(I)yrinic acid a,c-diamide adenosyltransferase [Corynebacterium sp.]|nr:cob(I)yrinic acid a,c-diamide adenosyltransferase [Corynebacterium sp.]
MPQGKLDPASIPDDGLTTRQRRLLPITAVHTGPGKGKSTAAFGMALRAWNQGMNLGIFQFVKSPKWKVGEEAVFRQLGQLHEDTGTGGPVEWHKMGEGWSWAKKKGDEQDHARDAREGWEELKRRLQAETHDFYVLDEFTYPLTWGWIDLDDVVETLKNRPGTQHVVMTGRNAPEALIEVADLVTEMIKIKHPMDVGRKGQRGIEW